MVRMHWYRQRHPDGEPLYPIDRVAALNEILMVRSENEYRVQRYAEKKAKAAAGKRTKRRR